MNKQLKALLASYARSVLSAGTALYLAGVTKPSDLVWSLVAAVAPVAIRYLNPNDPSFGRMPAAVEVEQALSVAKPKTAPVAKKAPVKKAAVK